MFGKRISFILLIFSFRIAFPFNNKDKPKAMKGRFDCKNITSRMNACTMMIRLKIVKRHYDGDSCPSDSIVLY